MWTRIMVDVKTEDAFTLETVADVLAEALVRARVPFSSVLVVPDIEEPIGGDGRAEFSEC